MTHTFWEQQGWNARNTIGQALAALLAREYDSWNEAYARGPEFHFAVRAAIAAPDAEHALIALLDGLAGLQSIRNRLIDAAIEQAKTTLPDTIFVHDGESYIHLNTVDKPPT